VSPKEEKLKGLAIGHAGAQHQAVRGQRHCTFPACRRHSFPAADRIDSVLRDARDNRKDLLACVKTFTAEEFSSIYCEREWRSLKPFSFSYYDIAMIVLPRRAGRTNYYSKTCPNQILIGRSYESCPTDRRDYITTLLTCAERHDVSATLRWAPNKSATAG
jgi:hypothetical protein